MKQDEKSELAEELHETDGVKRRSTNGDPHYSDKGSHKKRHDQTALERELERAKRREERKGKER